MSLALGKEARFAECRTEHSAKNLTWGPSLVDSLSSVLGGTRQRLNLCRVLLGRHSAKLTPLPSGVLDTRQRSRLRHPVAVTAAFLCRVLPGTRQTTVCRAFFAECHTWQSLYRVFIRLCRVLRALGKAPVSGSEGYSCHEDNQCTVFSIVIFSEVSPICFLIS
jgi:hypothetical protein